MLCGHSHRREETIENGLLFAQYGCYNQYVGHIELDYNFETRSVTYTKKEAITGYTINNEIQNIDDGIDSIINKYNSECEKAANEVVANNVNGSFASNEQLPNLMCKAIYEKAIDEGYDITLAYCNNARADLNYSTWTYANLYQAFPFDNEIYIIEASYNEMVNEIGKYNYIYRSPQFDGTLTPSKKYLVACLDYLMFHTNSSRYYDYFSDNNGKYVGVLEDNYRIILKDWLIEKGYVNGKQLNSGDYSSSLVDFSRSFTYN